MINYYWVINAMDCVPSEDGLTDVVKVVHWSRFASFGEILVSNYGTMSCETPSGTDFTAYPDLTYNQVCSWLDAGLDVPQLDVQLDGQIEMIINPPIVSLPLPSVNP